MEQWLLNNDTLAKVHGQKFPDYCDELFEDDSDVEESHSNLILKDDFNRFQCGDCGADCEDRTNLDGHIAAYHEFGTFFCEICPLQFSTNGDLSLHKLKCHETKF